MAYGDELGNLLTQKMIRDAQNASIARMNHNAIITQAGACRSRLTPSDVWGPVEKKKPGFFARLFGKV